MSVSYYARKVAQTPLKHLGSKAVRFIGRRLRASMRESADRLRPTYRTWPDARALIIPTGACTLAISDGLRDSIIAVAELYMQHRFNLLGSGWVRVGYGERYHGVEGFRYEPSLSVMGDIKESHLQLRINKPNQPRATQIWRLLDPGYTPIDWQVDFKSGYRWSEAAWYLKIPFGVAPGVDVKVPWELARMQHLTTLALAYYITRADAYSREFRNQILDFVANNPPRYGVNWNCTMDVAIRAANWLMAFDLFKCTGVTFDESFEKVLIDSLYDHGRHCVENLEYSPDLRSNHYLSDIVGLLFIAVYLPPSRETDNWLAFSVAELIHEVHSQFHDDGSNFEGSTSYHRLSAELVVYATALVLGLNEERHRRLRHHHGGARYCGVDAAPLSWWKPASASRPVPFPETYLKRVERMAEFTMDVTKPDGCVPQVGDNDSGRLLKLHQHLFALSGREAVERLANLSAATTDADRPFWDEDLRRHQHLVAAVAGLFDQRSDFEKFAGPGSIDMQVIRYLTNGHLLPSTRGDVSTGTAAESTRVGSQADWKCLLKQANGAGSLVRYHFSCPGTGLLSDLRLCGYPGFGLYVFRTERLYLAVRCGSIGQAGNGGHAHNDQLGLELTIDGRDVIVDPGTYLYTPLPELRNQYRSVKAHFAPRLGVMEPGRLNLGLFRLGDEAKARCLYFGPEGFGGVHYGYGTPVYRLVRLTETGLEVLDWATDDRLRLVKSFEPVAYSPGYGVKMNGKFPGQGTDAGLQRD